MGTTKTVDTKTIYEQLLKAKHTTAYALEKAANLGNKTVTAAIRRNTAISVETAKKIHSVYPDVSIDWLRTGEGDMIVPTSKRPDTKEGNGEPVDFVRQVPFEDFMEAPVLIREAMAGYLAAQGDVEYLDKLPTMLVPKEFDKGNYVVIETVGDSMDDGTQKAICDGDKLLVKEVDHNLSVKSLPIERNIYVIATLGEAPVVKQITEINKKKRMIVCHSWNKHFDDYPVFFDDIYKLFVVKKLVERQIRFFIP